MPDPDLHGTTADQLARLLAFHDQSDRFWEPGELRAILAHQLQLPPGVDDIADTPTSGKSTQPSSQRDLLCSDDPPVPLLLAMKDSAKAAGQDPNAPLPEEVATVLYFGAIAAALVRLDRRISRLDNAGLAWGFQWALEQPWLVDELRDLFRAGLQRVA